MPINKETSARLVKEKLPYEIFPRELVQSIANPVALAIWAYLMTKPENWIVRRTEITQHFGIGRDRFDAAMRCLKDMGLVWIAIVRDDKGKIVDRTIMVECSPKVGKPTRRENPQEGKTDHLKIQRVIKDTKIIKKGKIPVKTRDRTIEEDLTDTSWAGV